MTLGGAFLFVYMWGGYIGILGTIHNLQLIADIENPEIKRQGHF